MALFKLSNIIITAILFTSCRETEIMGKWRRMDILNSNLSEVNDSSKFGDLSISSDSTFFIVGSGKLDTSHISGWHGGASIDGIWRKPDRDHIILYINPKENNYFLKYKVVSLSKRKLVIILNMGIKMSLSEPIVYRRINK